MGVMKKHLEALRSIALSYPGTEEGVSCKGTKVESRAFKAGGKTFLFVGATHARLKLGKSAARAGKLDPDRYEVGAQGWTKIALGDGSLDLALMKRWVKESHDLLVGGAE